MMAEWIDRFHGRDTELGADAGADTDTGTLTLQAGNVPLRALTPQEKAYGEACRDYDSVKHETARLILNNLPQHDRLWVRGGEGSHKTRSMLANHGRIMVGRDHRLAMYAFDSYLKAAEKVREFNEQGHRHYHAVLLKSFSQSYGETCRRLALDPWTRQSARDAGFATVWHAMVETQEAVYQSLRDQHAAMWAEIGTRTPVLMTVHDVMQQWPEYSMTRWYWHRNWFKFWQKLGDRHRLRDETRLGLAVHDEIDQSAIVFMARWDAIQWVQAMAAHPSCRSWRAKVANEAAMAGEFDAYVAHHGGRTDVDFGLARMIQAHGRKSWQQVRSVNTGEYPRDENHTLDIYDAACGNDWGVVVTNWWNQLAGKVVVLTTELLPTVVATRADPTWYHLELNTPNLPRHEVRMRLDRRINRKEMQQAVDDLVAEIRPTLGDGAELHVVSNILKGSEVRSHKGARGSNGYIGKHVIQTMMHLSPVEYERLQVLNSWGRWDFAARLAHVDQFNQSAGRNQGPRRRGDVEHWLLISGKLWTKIDEIMVRFSRYDFTLVPSGRQSKSRAR